MKPGGTHSRAPASPASRRGRGAVSSPHRPARRAGGSSPGRARRRVPGTGTGLRNGCRARPAVRAGRAGNGVERGAHLVGRVADQRRQQRRWCRTGDAPRRSRRWPSRVGVSLNSTSPPPLTCTSIKPGASQAPFRHARGPACPAGSSRRGTTATMSRALDHDRVVAPLAGAVEHRVGARWRAGSSRAGDLLQVARPVRVDAEPAGRAPAVSRKSSGSGRSRRWRDDRAAGQAAAGRALVPGSAVNSAAPLPRRSADERAQPRGRRVGRHQHEDRIAGRRPAPPARAGTRRR